MASGNTREDVVGVLLAGGQARRMGGGDKSLRRLGDRTILEHVIERARPQVAALVLNANGDPARFARFGLPVAADVVEGFAGPLAGVLTGMEWARAQPAGLRLDRDDRDRHAVLSARIWSPGCARRSGAPTSPAPARTVAPTRCSACGPCASPTICGAP